MFSPDSKFMEILGRITDLILLNILFLLTCLPIFTMGAAATALYTMCFRFMREEYRSIVKPYFQAFRDNFRQSTLIWLLLLLWWALVFIISMCCFLWTACCGIWVFSLSSLLCCLP